MTRKTILAYGLAGMLVFLAAAAPGGEVYAENNRTDTVSENGVSRNTISENTLSENTLSENTLSENTISENELLQAPLAEAVSLEWNGLGTEDVGTEDAGTEDAGSEDGGIEEAAKQMLVLSPVSVTLSMQSYQSVCVSWTPLADAQGYEIYRSTRKNKKYVLVKCISDGSRSSYIDKTKKLITGKKYYYQVRAFAYDSEGQKIYGEASAPKKITYSVPAVKLSSVKPVANGGLKLKWTKVKGANGYEIYRAKTENGKYKKVAAAEAGSIKSYTLDAKSSKGSYYYKVRAYRLNGSKKIYGEYSQIMQAQVASLAYDGESYWEKCMRVFGKASYQPYATQNKAAKNMTTITVKVWDFDTKGQKVTKYKTIQIHKNLALTVEAIFKEIYEGKEKFPIKAVGGYSWRGNGSTSEHNNGTALDLNPNENYMIEGNGTIASGSYWKPESDPYSIPANGEVVKIFKKYGFRWGGLGWSSGRKDYMHFSYFGT